MSGNATIISPCIGVCILDTERGHCRGCRRTLEEIGAWLHYTAAERAAIMRELASRHDADERSAVPPARTREKDR